MTAITVKNIPDTLYERLKTVAKEHRRSVNSEIIVRLQRSLEPNRVDVEGLLAKARELRARIERPFTVEEIDEFRMAGRR